MKACASLIVAAAVSFLVDIPMPATAWIPPLPSARRTFIVAMKSNKEPVTDATKTFAPTTTTIQVCHGKDCKRIGGGPKLLRAVDQLVQEDDERKPRFKVESCSCQGECGYGPNLVVNNKVVNSVKGRAAILQALGLPNDAATFAAAAPTGEKEE